MKQKIYRSLCLIALLSLFLSTIASLSLYMNFYNKNNQSDLQSHCTDLAIAAAEIENLGGDVLSFLKEAADPSVRITLIQPDGVVVWDSQAEATHMVNHADREEIVEALQGEMGLGSRYSNTIGQESYYCALQFGENNLILRLGRTSQNMLGTFLQILPLDMLSCVLLFLVCLILATQETRNIVKPLLKAADHLDTIDSSAFYEELTPFIETIREQNDTIRAQLDAMRQDKDTITLILKSMKEGLVMLSKEKRILSINNSAMEMLGCYVDEPEGQNFLALTRELPLVHAVDQALSGQNASGFLQPANSDRIYQYFGNPVHKTEKQIEITGAILFLMDVTEQQRAQKLREEFSANVSHELKTPLTSISGFAELMESGMASSSDDVKMFSNLIRKESSRLLTLIDDIIRLTRIDNTEQTLEPVDLYAMAQEECEHLFHAAKKKNISIHCSGESAVINGNRTLLQEAVYNLCENAVKYNKQDGSVHVSVTSDGEHVTLLVSDTGIGIPKEHQNRIFERFYRVDKSRSKETGGTGLGLSIVKHVVQTHGGQLSIDSELGQGCTFRAVFPILPDLSQDN